MSDVKFSIKGLNDFKKALGNIPQVRVGVFGDKNDRGDGTTNAVVGAAHEFGTSKLPRRSFLRMPLKDNLEKYLEANGAFNKDILAKILKTKSLEPWCQLIGATGVEVVTDAFVTGGFGKWKPSKMQYKKNKETLVEDGKLRDSIEFEVD